MLTTYKVLIRSLIDYTPSALAIMNDANYMIIERIQRAAVRMVVHWPGGISTKEIYKRLKLDDIMTRSVKILDKCFFKAILHNRLIRQLPKWMGAR